MAQELLGAWSACDVMDVLASCEVVAENAASGCKFLARPVRNRSVVNGCEKGKLCFDENFRRVENSREESGGVLKEDVGDKKLQKYNNKYIFPNMDCIAQDSLVM